MQQLDEMEADAGDAAGPAGVKQQAGENGADNAGAAGASPATAGRPEAPKETMEEAAARRRAEANILRRAAAIREAQAKAALAAETPPYELQRARCHWDYVLAEMAWMAVDFASERIWKLNAAAQLGAAAVAAKGSPKMKKLSDEGQRKIVAARAAACVTGALSLLVALLATPLICTAQPRALRRVLGAHEEARRRRGRQPRRPARDCRTAWLCRA